MFPFCELEFCMLYNCNKKKSKSTKQPFNETNRTKKKTFNKHYSIRKTKIALKKNWIIIPSHLPQKTNNIFQFCTPSNMCTFTNVFFPVHIKCVVKTSILPPHIILCALRIKKKTNRIAKIKSPPHHTCIYYNHHNTKPNNSNSLACDFCSVALTHKSLFTLKLFRVSRPISHSSVENRFSPKWMTIKIVKQREKKVVYLFVHSFIIHINFHIQYSRGQIIYRQIYIGWSTDRFGIKKNIVFK